MKTRILNKKFGSYRISFNEDLTLAGIVKVTGRCLIPPSIIDMENPYQLSLYGYAVVQFAGERDWTLIDSDGNVVIKGPIIKHQSDKLRNFQDFTVLIGKDNLYGLYNPVTNKKSNISYTSFVHCGTYIQAYSKNKVGALSLDLEEIIKPEHKKIEWFCQGIFKVEEEDGSSRLYRISDQKWSKMHCDFIDHGDFIEPLDLSGRGIIDKADFEELLPSIYKRVERFGNLFKGFLEDQSEVIMGKGWKAPSEECVKIYEETYGFIRGITSKSIGLKYIFLSPKNGNRIVNEEYDSALPPKGEKQWAFARRGDTTYHIDRDGKTHSKYSINR